MNAVLQESIAPQAVAHGPSSDFLRSQLPDIADGLKAMLLALQADPHPYACELAAIRLDAARRHVQQLAVALRWQS